MGEKIVFFLKIEVIAVIIIVNKVTYVIPYSN